MVEIARKGFRGLIAWQEAKALTLKIYKITKEFPKEEQFGMTDQMRRAASSAMANIAEGAAMPTKAHRDRFYAIARGSVNEVDNFSELSAALGYISNEQFADIGNHAARLSYLITNLMKSR